MKLETLNKDHFYHIYNRGINSGLIFMNNENKSYFLKLFKKYLTGKCSVFAYCLMDNHFHFLVRVDSDNVVITQAFSNFFNSYAKAYNKYANRTVSLFEKHFKRIKVGSEEYLRNLIVYIHRNPKHHCDERFENFKFSSYQEIIKGDLSFINSLEVVSYFGDVENFSFAHRQEPAIDSEYFL